MPASLECGDSSPLFRQLPWHSHSWLRAFFLVRHTFNYKLMKDINRGKQMKSVWEIASRERQPPSWPVHHESRNKVPVKHPTQKPLALLERILQASTNEGDADLDPFLGSGTTAIAALKLCRTAIGLELSVLAD